MRRIKGNFHTHTTFCDGKNTAREMAEQAAASGFTHLGFSGHMDSEIHMDLAAYDREIRRLQEEYRPGGPGCGEKGPGRDWKKEVRVGKDRTETEQAVCPGGLDILRGVELDVLYEPRDGAERELLRGMEYLIGSTHYIEAPSGGPLGSVDDTRERLETFCREEFGGDYYRLSRAYYETEAGIVNYIRDHFAGPFFIGHFDLITRFNDEMHVLDESSPRYYGPALEVMEYLVSKDIPLEINCGAVNRGRKAELYPNRFLLRHLREMGGRILISSDAHQRELLDGCFEDAVRTAAECGFTHTNILEHDRSGAIVWRQVPLDVFG